MRSLSIFLPFFLLMTSLLFAEESTQRVGLPLVISERYLPGPLLEAVPRRDRDLPLVVRILEVKPAQDGFRYSIEVQGLDAGTYNLGDYLREANTEQKSSSQQLPITITTALEPGLVPPTELTPVVPPRTGGYRSLLWVLGIVWVAGLVALIFHQQEKGQHPQ